MPRPDCFASRINFRYDLDYRPYIESCRWISLSGLPSKPPSGHSGGFSSPAALRSLCSRSGSRGGGNSATDPRWWCLVHEEESTRVEYVHASWQYQVRGPPTCFKMPRIRGAMLSEMLFIIFFGLKSWSALNMIGYKYCQRQPGGGTRFEPEPVRVDRAVAWTVDTVQS